MSGHEDNRNGKDTDNLLFNDLNENVFSFDSLPLEPDHCDLLLDAMDGQLEELQVWSRSPSKGAGLENTTQTSDTPMFCLDLLYVPNMEKTSEDPAGCLESSVSQRETIKILDRSTSDDEEGASRREQVIWRLERLLGDAWKEGEVVATRPPSESICTEDFVRRFREEMVDLSPTDRMGQLNEEEEADGIEISDRNQSNQDRPSVEKKGSLTANPVMDHWSCSNEHQKKCNSGNCGVNMSPVNEEEDIHKGVSVRSLDSMFVSNSDTTREENNPQSASVRDQANVPAHKTLSIRRKTCRLVSSLRDNKDINEGEQRSGGPVRTTEMQSDWNKMKEKLLNLQKKSEKEEKKLKLKCSQLKDAESWLSELQQKKKHALQHLEQLGAEAGQMEQKRRDLEFLLRDTRAEKRSVSFQQQLQRQRDSCLLQVQKDEHLAALSRHKQILQDRSCINTESVPSKAMMSELQCEEMERQLDWTRTELFTEQRRARDKIQFLQEKLEETCEELLRATEAERSLRNRCAALENQLHRNEQTEQSEETALRLQTDVELQTETEQQLRFWAQQLTAEGQQLHLLVERDGAQGAEELHQSFTLAESLSHLRAKREQLQLFIGHLQQKLESQKRTNEQLKKEKEQELSIQKQQLKAEKDRALNSLRMRLIQEHIEELSSVKCAREREAGGVAASLRRQLQDKNKEFRQLQRSMAQWKQQTAARLAAKFEEQITAELERCKAELIRSRKALQIQEVRPERETHGAKKAVCSHWLHAVDSAAHVPSDLASLKLLHHLQSKVKQLRGENQTFMWEPNPPHTVALNMSGTFLTDIGQGADGAVTQSQTSFRTVSSKESEPSLSVTTFTSES